MLRAPRPGWALPSWVIACLLAGVVTVVAAPAPARAAPPLRFGPVMHDDARDAVGAPVDIRGVAFGQRETRLVWRVRAAAPWLTSRAVQAGRWLCLTIEPVDLRRDLERVCLGADHGRAVLRLHAITRDGRGGPPRRLHAAVTRPDRLSLRAAFAPRDVGLAPGTAFRWWVEARWRRASRCAEQDCLDRVPDTAAFEGRAVALGEPRCFGAAGRGRGAPCVNPDLRGVVVPPPADAPLTPESHCTPVRAPAALASIDACAFGVLNASMANTFALLGDSHARQWRAALEVVAEVRGWRGLSITRPGCPFSVQIPGSPDLGPGACLAQHAGTVAWLRAHPQVRTVFVSSWAQPPSGPHGGVGGYGGGAAAFGAMLDRLPASVRHVYVLRDNPGASFATPDCVTIARRHGRVPDTACALPRGSVLTADPAASAARGRGPRVRVIDLTRHFCDARRCYPVVGGVYVYRDDNHMNSVFAKTLGPYVLRALDDRP